MLIVYLIERNVLEESLVPFSLSVIIALPFFKAEKGTKAIRHFYHYVYRFNPPSN